MDRKKAAIICTVTLLLQLLFFILTVIDFITDTNEGNVLRIIIKLFIKITIKLTSFCCKHSILNKVVNRNANSNVNTNHNVNVRYIPSNSIDIVELEPLKNQRFAALEDLTNS